MQIHGKNMFFFKMLCITGASKPPDGRQCDGWQLFAASTTFPLGRLIRRDALWPCFRPFQLYRTSSSVLCEQLKRQLQIYHAMVSVVQSFLQVYI